MRGGLRLAAATLAAALLTLLPACGSRGPAPVDSLDGYGPAPKGYYRIRPGDTLGEIAERRRVRLKTLAGWNGLTEPYGIYAGRLLRVEPPDGRSKPAASQPAVAAAAEALPSRPTAQGGKRGGTKAGASGLKWRWPLEGRVMKTFSRSDRTRQGIRIAGRPGDRVAAAEAGTVVYSGSGLKGYGNLIIVQHKNDYLSAYGFNRRLLAAEGARVARGQSLAEVGQAPGGEHLLHFEIRKDGTAVDPLDYLPAAR
jgi:lipoprotein NlpD